MVLETRVRAVREGKSLGVNPAPLGEKNIKIETQAWPRLAQAERVPLPGAPAIAEPGSRSLASEFGGGGMSCTRGNNSSY